MKIIDYRFTAYVMHMYSMCVRLSGSLAYPDILWKADVCDYARSDCTSSPQEISMAKVELYIQSTCSIILTC